MILRFFRTALLAFTLVSFVTAIEARQSIAASSGDLEILDRALDLAEADAPQAILSAEAIEEPALRKLVEWRRLLRSGPDAGFEALQAFLQQNPHWPGRQALRRYAAEAMDEAAAPSAVASWYRSHPPLDGKAGLRYAMALRATGMEEDARDEARKIWHGMSLTSDQADKLLAAFGYDLGEEDHRRRLEWLLQQGDSSALQVASLLGESHRRLAEARLKLTRMEAGVDDAIERIPEQLRNDPGLTYARAHWRLRMDFNDSAFELLDPAPPVSDRDAEHWWRTKRWAAREALKQGEPELAYRIASHHGSEAGLSMAEGEFLAGWIALRFLHDPEQAYRHFDRLYHNVSMPISIARGAYWAGEAARAMGREDWATQWYQVAAQQSTVFYGQMAALHLGAVPGGGEAVLPAVSASKRAEFDASELVQVVEALVQLQRDDLLPLFFAALRVQAESIEDYVLVGELAQRLGHAEQAIRTGRIALRNGIELNGLLYPAPPVDLSADPDGPLLLGLMRQESAFNPEAVSPVGARGLMQLMPGTAELVAGKIGASYSLARLTSDPDYNVRLGRQYLEGLLERYDGFLPLALAAYNAGPGRADRWIREYGDPRDAQVGPIDWIEQIPFSETRNYVQRVLESYTVYQQRLRPQDDPFAALPEPLPVSVQRSQSGSGESAN